MNTDEAREYFKPLTYKDITFTDIQLLRFILMEELCKINKIRLHQNSLKRDYIFELCPLRKNKYKFKDGLVCCYLEVLCDNYSKREAISFNQDGFIGFAGWSSSNNVKPFIDAFVKWVDWKKQWNN